MRRVVAMIAAAVGLTALTGGVATAREYQVAMVNRSAEGAMVFTPGYLKIAPGDTVRFLPQDKGHNAESIATMTPAGAPTFKGAINQELVVRFARPGVYGYKCLPHLGMGMVGVIQVGDAVNLAAATEQAAKLPPLAARRLAGYLAKARPVSRSR